MQRIIKRVIDTVILILFLITFLGTLVTTNLNGQVIGGIGAVFVIIFYLGYLFRNHLSFLKNIQKMTGKYHVDAKWFFSVLALIYQMILLISLATETGFDTGIMKWAATSKSIVPESYLANYFSQNPTDLSFMFVERGLYHIVNGLNLTNFTLVLDIINLILVDISIVLVGLVLKRHLNKATVWVLAPLVILISPWIVIVYTDTFVLPFISGMILMMDILATDWLASKKPKKQFIWQSALLGLLTWAAYALKPTAMILIIALILELAFVLIFNRTKFDLKTVALSLLVAAVCFGVCQGANQLALKHQQFVSINPNQKELPSHYLMMGMNKETYGSYSHQDYLYSTKFPTKKTQQSANFKMIRKRLQNFGFGGYARFLLAKNYYNTNDGTLGWLKEGDFFNKPSFKKHKFIRSFYYPYGSNLRISQTILQAIWILIFAGVVFSFLDKIFFIRVLRMSLFGLLFYLLLFEGGQSRYLIQFLPIIYVLAIFGWQSIFVWFKKKKIMQRKDGKLVVYLGVKKGK
ncbi:hypothetical protein [Pediococcus cellicola]|uniref:Integral membrane protein n=1 Tax=Pediococcus cellicola TaxID=319652 RepID=A0A0R2IVD2_9LACO|nr:hypothetical protein [Pediococcus cellicola]KRN66885.1 integral membrane protein [Pediococcus cellicola]GEL15964.1 membrane protein [Pediococcus cellicola]